MPTAVELAAMTKEMWYLGASDPEMTEIERVLADIHADVRSGFPACAGNVVVIDHHRPGERWAREHLQGVYGDPSRGFAGGYVL